MNAWLRYYVAVREADKAHENEGSRFYVVPKGDGTKLLIMDRRNFRRYKFKGYIDRRAKVMDLEKDCFYCTPYRDGSGGLPDEVVEMKKKLYWKWVGLMSRAKHLKA